MVERVTHAYEGPLAVFLIGLRVHKPWRVGVVGSAVRAMPRMIVELERNKAAAARGEAEDLGFLGATTLFGVKGPTVIQWWRSTEQLYAYASAPDNAHLPAWRAFNSAVRRSPGAVGIWHETYAVPAGAVETIYGGSEGVGLGGVVGTVPVQRRGRSARERIGARVA